MCMQEGASPARKFFAMFILYELHVYQTWQACPPQYRYICDHLLKFCALIFTFGSILTGTKFYPPQYVQSSCDSLRICQVHGKPAVADVAPLDCKTPADHAFLSSVRGSWLFMLTSQGIERISSTGCCWYPNTGVVSALMPECIDGFYCDIIITLRGACTDLILDRAREVMSQVREAVDRRRNRIKRAQFLKLVCIWSDLSLYIWSFMYVLHINYC